VRIPPRRRNVLAYSTEKVSQATVARHYREWRRAQGLRERCDNPKCRFHTKPLRWNSRCLPVILDHVHGNRWDNRAEMLRYLCPNCDSQLDTRGGANKRRVKTGEHGFVILSRDGRRAYTYFGTGRVRPGGTARAGFVPALARE
jgi:uncharacterized protein YlaI